MNKFLVWYCDTFVGQVVTPVVAGSALVAAYTYHHYSLVACAFVVAACVVAITVENTLLNKTGE